MGKISTSKILEDLFKDKIENILLKYFKGIKTNADAVAKMHKITKGTVKVSHVTIQKMVYLAHTNKLINPDDFPFAYVDVPAKTGHRGKISIREILEKKKGKPFWEIIEPYKNMPKEEAAKDLNVNYTSILNTIRRAIEKGEVFNGIKISEANYPHWFKQKKIKQKKNPNTSNPQEAKEDMLKVKAICSECGHARGWYESSSFAGPKINVGLKSTRCNQCHKWQTYVATIEVNGVKIIKKVIPHGIDNLLYEDFVDKDGNQIHNPLLPTA